MLFGLSTGGIVLLAISLAAAHSVGGFTSATQIDFAHWRSVLHGRVFWLAFGYSACLTLVTLGLALALALGLVLALGEQVRHGVLARMLYLPLAVPGTVAALLSYALLSDAGLLSRLALSLGRIRQPADFPALIFDPLGLGIVLTHVAMIAPFFVLLFDRQCAHERLPLYLRQAEALGATRRQALTRVALPLLARGVKPVVAVYGVALLGAFEVPLLIGSAYPAMISIEIHRQINAYDMTLRPEGYAMAVLYLVILVTVWASFSWRGARPKPAP